jgi:hypothetical protein
VLKIPPLSDRYSVMEISRIFGGPEKMKEAVEKMQVMLQEQGAGRLKPLQQVHKAALRRLSIGSRVQVERVEECAHPILSFTCIVFGQPGIGCR